MTALAPVLQRAHGRAHVGFRRNGALTRLADLHQEGAAKVRLPRIFDGPPEAVLVNTAGGLTDGDLFAQSVTVEAGASAVVTTQACERLYRARGLALARVANTLRVGANARLLWLPQETILFEGGRLERRLQADIAPGGRLLLVEAGLLGRAAMGETPRTGLMRERWDVAASGRLLFAERASIGGEPEDSLARTTHGPATLRSARAFATLLLAAPGDDLFVARAVDLAREAVPDGDAHVGISGWAGKLVARIVAPGGEALRHALVPLLETLSGHVLDTLTPRRLPKVWAI